MLSHYLASQLACPHGLLGRLFLGRLWNTRNRALNDLAFVRLAANAGDHILEIGFGGGYLIDRLSVIVTTGLVAGVDVSAAMAQGMRSRRQCLIEQGRLTLQQAAAESLPFPDRSFDKVCSVNSLFYWTDPPRAFAEIARVLRPDGMLVLVFTNRQSLQTKDFAKHGLNLFEPEKVRGFLLAAGFREVLFEEATDRHRTFVVMQAQR